MNRRQKHPDRRDMLKAIRSQSKTVLKHLQQCESCSELHSLLQRSGAADPNLVLTPPDDLLKRNRAVVRLVESRHPRRTVSANLISDSWSTLPAAAVRDSSPDIERRVRFESAGYILEFVANRHLAEWDFVARVYEGGEVSREFVLQTGSRKMPTGKGDCYFWRSKRPPRRLQLLSPGLRIDLGSLEW